MFCLKWPCSDVPKVIKIRGLNSLKVAERGVAFDVVFLLEAIKLGGVHIHSCQHLYKNNKYINVKKNVTSCHVKAESQEQT